MLSKLKTKTMMTQKVDKMTTPTMISQRRKEERKVKKEVQQICRLDLTVNLKIANSNEG
jgi:hypothetical protein